MLPVTGAIVPVGFRFGGQRRRYSYASARQPQSQPYHAWVGRTKKKARNPFKQPSKLVFASPEEAKAWIRRSQRIATVQSHSRKTTAEPATPWHAPRSDYEPPKYSVTVRRSLMWRLARLEPSRPKSDPYDPAAKAAGNGPDCLRAYTTKIIAHLRAKPGIPGKEMDYVLLLSDLLCHYDPSLGDALRRATSNCYVSDFKKPVPPPAQNQNPSTAPVGAKQLPWRVLPPGKWRFSDIRSHFMGLSKRWGMKRSDLGRLDFAKSLRPTETWIGEDEFDGYVIFLFSWTRAALLDRPLKSNACYILRRDWKKLSHLSKFELLQSYRKSVVRIIHRGGWRKRARKELKRDKA